MPSTHLLSSRIVNDRSHSMNLKQRETILVRMYSDCHNGNTTLRTTSIVRCTKDRAHVKGREVRIEHNAPYPARALNLIV
jgi:hypothetical protein